MNCDCKKKDSIREYAYSEENAPIYKDLGTCLDCNGQYIFRNNKWYQISGAEFRRIVFTRRELLNNRP